MNATPMDSDPAIHSRDQSVDQMLAKGSAPDGLHDRSPDQSVEAPADLPEPRGIAVSGAQIAALLRERGWLGDATTPEIEDWLVEAAALLGPQAADMAALEDLLTLIFRYDAQELLARPASHAVIVRESAREVLRALGTMVLEGLAVDSGRYKEIVAALRAGTGSQGQKLFYPVRLALAGRIGGGALDRVILLLDGAATLPFRSQVKSNRQRILEFCAAMD